VARSKCGDTLARTLMYEAAVVLMTRVKRASGLKEWAQAIARRSGAGKARVALARKLSVIMHSIWPLAALTRPSLRSIRRIASDVMVARRGEGVQHQLSA
jgi:hypothetical protein